MKFSNKASVSLPIAVWLARDTYDYVQDPTYLSATTLLRPVRQIVLSKRVPEGAVSDISDMIASSMGTAIHDGIEAAWVNNHAESLKALGFDDDLVKRVLVNPTKEELAKTPDAIPVYLEQRAIKEIAGFKIGGKYDFVGEGRVNDFKSTSTYTYQHGTKDDDYALQGSIYRWLNPTIITQDDIAIQFIFTDFSKLRAMTEADKGYPPTKVLEHRVPLLSLDETEAFILNKLQAIKQYMDADEVDIPLCTKKELWQGESVFKYFKNPEGKRATKNFDNRFDAEQRMLDDGSVGIIKEVVGEAKACLYCPAFAACKQKDALIAQGLLKV